MVIYNYTVWQWYPRFDAFRWVYRLSKLLNIENNLGFPGKSEPTKCFCVDQFYTAEKPRYSPFKIICDLCIGKRHSQDLKSYFLNFLLRLFGLLTSDGNRKGDDKSMNSRRECVWPEACSQRDCEVAWIV